MRQVDWEHVYLLGSYGRDGEAYLTTWSGNRPEVEVVVTGVHHAPMWDAPVPMGAELHEVPKGTDGQEYAKELDGIYAFGWYVEEGFERERR